VAVQFHPELKSRPTKAHPLFRDLVKAGLRYKKDRRSTLSEEKESVKK
jgi:CTP synthase